MSAQTLNLDQITWNRLSRPETAHLIQTLFGVSLYLDANFRAVHIMGSPDAVKQASIGILKLSGSNIEEYIRLYRGCVL